MTFGFSGSNCLEEELGPECINLKASKERFDPYPYEKKIRLTLSSPSQLLPLNLTLQHGNCNFSCEGGTVSACIIHTESYFWQDVSSPYDFDTGNFTPRQFYCATATIGRCCEVCTHTIYMEDFTQPHHFSADNVITTFSTVLTVAILFIVISIATFAITYIKASHHSNHERSTETRLTLIKPQSSVENEITGITVMCLYEKDKTQHFQDDIFELKSFLCVRGLDTIDIYDEEENINSSFTNWVQSVLTNKKLKILLIDSEAIRPLWLGSHKGCRELKAVQQAIIYIGSSIPLNELFNRLFIVRLESVSFPSQEFIYPGSGRVYLFPKNKERLWKDLGNST